MWKAATALGLVCLCSFAQQQALDKYCLACHNAKVKTAGLALEPESQNPELMEKVVRRLGIRHMPPAGLPRPDEAGYNALIAAIETKLDRAKPDPGRTGTFRRLNRTEYRNAIRDLLALDIDVSALLPADDASHGFDNVTVGDLSPTLLERYLSAARKISRLALGIPPKSPGGETITLPADLTQEDHFEGLPIGTRGGATVRHNFPVDAEYDVQLRLARDRNEHVEGIAGKHQVELMLDGERVKVFTVQLPPPGSDHSQIDAHLKIRIPVKAGPHTVAAAFIKLPSALLETERQPYQAHFNMDRHPRVQPAVYSVSINGPYNAAKAGDTPSRKRILVCEGKDEECARKILSTLMRRAYRRPVTAADIKSPLKFFNETSKVEGFDAGLEMALCAVLVSPEFLFRVEQDPVGVAPGTAYRIAPLELASRLSFFLWSSIPDDELLNAAIQDKLRGPELDNQVRRMLADPRSRNLVTNFAGQWLYLRNLAQMTPDMRTFPDFDDNLRQAFQTETELFVESIMRQDSSILRLIDADYTFVNQRLAKHYGIPNIYGSRFRRVNVADRGGLLRQGSILTVTSYATRTSPVVRGKWIMENLLGVTPPPPPPKTPVLGERRQVAGRTLTMRERMFEHRKNPACSGCHQLLDPIGFTLEHYDAVGRWRDTEEASPIDAMGAMPDGRTFNGVEGLQQALLARPELFASTFAAKLMTYSLGRGVEYYDAPAIRKIVRDARANDFRFSSFIIGIVNSTPFQMRRSPQQPS